jgi:acetyl esterase/lipase
MWKRPFDACRRTPISLRAMLGEIAALIAGGLVLFMEIWTIVPAPNLATLGLAVVIPEVTPWAILTCLGAGAIALCAARGWARGVGLTCAATALGLALVPWSLLPSTIAACEQQMRLGLGSAYPAANARAEQSPSALRRPYDIGVALLGYGAASPVGFRANLPVPTRDGARLGLDLYTPAGRGPHPAVVVIYGGAWLFGSRAASAELATWLAQRGYTAIAIDYRHAPLYVFPTQIDDVRDALAAIARNAGAWGIDPTRVAILGRSAGAELALIAAYDPGPLRIRAAIGYYAPIDMVQGFRLPPRPDPAEVPRIARLYIGGTPEDRMNNYVASSPIAHVRPGLPPTLLIGGARDELVRLPFQHEMRDMLRRRGDAVASLDLPWSNHAFDTIPNGTAGQIARYYTERFLAATL